MMPVLSLTLVSVACAVAAFACIFAGIPWWGGVFVAATWIAGFLLGAYINELE